MEVSSNSQPIDSSIVRLKRFNLDEQLSKVASFTQLPEKNHTVDRLFDWQFYLTYYEDLSSLSNAEEAYEHWQIHGRIEGRLSNEAELEDFFSLIKSQLPDDFDYEQYLALNLDLKAKLRAHYYKQYRATEHYLKYRENEERPYHRNPSGSNQDNSRTLENCSRLDAVYLERDHQDSHRKVKPQDNMRLIAFYLPQFHSIPENDRWWGKGFTEWTNVTRARPLFENHYQPHLPADLGFYDLRVPEVREAQANLAKQYGIHGFCYYYYWFAGKRLLHRPLDEMLHSQAPDLPFCLCWANENWTRRWDGAEQDILMAQEHSPENDRAFAEDLIQFLADPRYIRVQGKPLILVYRVDILPDPLGATQRWRAVFRERGIGEVHLCAAFTFGMNSDPAEFGFDAGVQFPPHGVSAKIYKPHEVGAGDFTGNIYEFTDVVKNSLAVPMPKDYSLYLGVMTGWDNSARKRKAANIFLNSGPEVYERWLHGCIEKTIERYQGDEQLIFINAWNEWAEGTHLEPDQKYGHQFLTATHNALSGNHSTESALGTLRFIPVDSEAQLNRLVDDLQTRIEAQERAINAMTALMTRIKQRVLTVSGVTMHPQEKGGPVFFNIECPYIGEQVSAEKVLMITGWILGSPSRPARVELSSGDRIIVENKISLYRHDVYQSCPEYESEHSGFWLMAEVNKIPGSEVYLNAVLEDGTYAPLGSIQFQVEEHPVLASIDLRKQIYWDELHRDDLKTLLTRLRTFPIEMNYYQILDELEYIIRNREQVFSGLTEFLRMGSVSDFF